MRGVGSKMGITTNKVTAKYFSLCGFLFEVVLQWLEMPQDA